MHKGTIKCSQAQCTQCIPKGKSFLRILTGDQQVNWFFYKDWKDIAQHTSVTYMELRGTRGSMGGSDLRGQGLGFNIPATATPVSSIITAVRQQDYSASVWLRRREKLEHVSPERRSWVWHADGRKWNAETKAGKMFGLSESVKLNRTAKGTTETTSTVWLRGWVVSATKCHILAFSSSEILLQEDPMTLVY